MSGLVPDSVRKRLLVVDDHAVVRLGLRQLLGREPDLIVCGEVGTVREAVEAIRRLKPDMVIADISLVNGSGLDLVKEIRRSNSRLPVLVLSMHDETLFAERALKAGANGYIMKMEAPQELVIAVRTVLAGQVFVSRKMVSRLLNRFHGGSPEAGDPVETLTDRELQLFTMIGSGLTTKEIAGHLCVSPKTVDSHRSSIKRKLQVGTTVELTCMAARWVERKDLD
ncbi:MAG: response regulator transcription factor [Deltaproteobacteria bacterium]|nr:response regulator transcription factor [Deltaproteobacteria bacterium]